MAVRRRKAGPAAADKGSLKRTNSLERLLDSCRAVWYLKGISNGLQRLRQSRGPAKAPAVAKATGGEAVELSATKFAAGACFFGLITFLAGACPWVLPWTLVGFAAVGLPCRAYSFWHSQPVNRFFLLDFCYFVNVAIALFLLLPAPWLERRGLAGPLEAALYALADGPVAGALVVWQCAWVFPSADHTLSVIMHLLPGLAMYARRHLPPRASSSLCKMLLEGHSLPTLCSPSMQPVCADGVAGLRHAALWLLLAPLAFYLAWQLLYWVTVQVLCRHYIKRHGFDTSYKCLARRAARADNFWSRLVLRGSTARRLFWFGLVQFAFTLATLLAFIATYYLPQLALAWQVCKFAFPVYHGAKYTCERMIKAAIADGIKRSSTSHLSISDGLLRVGSSGGRKSSYGGHGTAPAS